jgi:hypothetical protein
VAEGLNVDVGAFASPVWEIAGQEDDEHLRALDNYDPDTFDLSDMGNLPAYGGIGTGGTEGAAAAVRQSIPGAAKKSPATTVKRATNPHQTLFWLALLFVLYLGVLSVQVHARVGR